MRIGFSLNIDFAIGGVTLLRNQPESKNLGEQNPVLNRPGRILKASPLKRLVNKDGPKTVAVIRHSNRKGCNKFDLILALILLITDLGIGVMADGPTWYNAHSTTI